MGFTTRSDKWDSLQDQIKLYLPTKDETTNSFYNNWHKNTQELFENKKHYSSCIE